MNQACEKCPLEIVLNSAESVVNELDHTAAEATKGGIALTRLCFGKVLENTGCQGATTSSNNQAVCPLSDMTMHTRALATSPWPANAYDVDLKKLGGNIEQEELKVNGMYL